MTMMFLAGYSVAMVTYCVTKMITTCSPMIGQFLDSTTVASTDKETHQDLCLVEVFETILSHLIVLFV